MCVVLVEDEPVLRMLAAEVLTEAGHTVVEFTSAADAMAYAAVAENWLTTVVTDINMPGEKDGLDLAIFIWNTRPQASVIVTSGRYGVLPFGMPDGIAFLPKPWTANRLVEMVGACPTSSPRTRARTQPWSARHVAGPGFGRRWRRGHNR